MDFEGLGFGHYQTICLMLYMNADAWKNGPLHAEVMAILEFSGRIAELLKP
jgi:hypothetical protein